MAIGAGWADGAWVDAGWVTGAWEQTGFSIDPEILRTWLINADNRVLTINLESRVYTVDASNRETDI